MPRRTGPVTRLLALLAALLVPGLGGAWLQLGHPCPATETRTVAVHAGPGGHHPGAAHAHGTGHERHESPPHQHEGATCTCVGACHHAPALLPSADPVGLAVAAAAPARTAPPLAASWLPHGHPFDLLPPATAPPLA